MTPKPLEDFKALARAVKYRGKYARAVRLARRGPPAGWRDAGVALSPVFIVACGRSGTTVLGGIFERHPEVVYLMEPYHLWAAVNPLSDMVNLYTDAPPRCVMDAGDADDAARRRFEALFLSRAPGALGKRLVDKTPINAMRLGFLDALAPGARCVHIVRDGVMVARSIDRLASERANRILGKPRRNPWWGVDDGKWRALLRDAERLGLFPAEDLARLANNRQRGALEWLVSLHIVDAHRAALADRLHELRYTDLTDNPRETLAALCVFMGIGAPEAWLDAGCATLYSRPDEPREELPLPASMAHAFNALQDRFGFRGRASVMA